MYSKISLATMIALIIIFVKKNKLSTYCMYYFLYFSYEIYYTYTYFFPFDLIFIDGFYLVIFNI